MAEEKGDVRSCVLGGRRRGASPTVIGKSGRSSRIQAHLFPELETVVQVSSMATFWVEGTTQGSMMSPEAMCICIVSAATTATATC